MGQQRFAWCEVTVERTEPTARAPQAGFASQASAGSYEQVCTTRVAGDGPQPMSSLYSGPRGSGLYSDSGVTTNLSVTGDRPTGTLYPNQEPEAYYPIAVPHQGGSFLAAVQGHHFQANGQFLFLHQSI